MINTVLGKIDKSELGCTLSHEHIIIDLTDVRGDLDSKLSNIDLMVAELKLSKEAGVDSIIEVTNIGMGRDVKKLKEISEKSGINIISSTGFYTIPYYPEYIKTKSVDELAEIIISEITEGIDGTDIKAGVIGEIGTSLNKLEDISLKVFDSAVIAHEKTGVPIFTHCEIGTMGFEQATYLNSKGINMDKVVIGHMDLVKDEEYIIKVLETGANIGFDTIGKESYVSNLSKAKTIANLIELGYEDKILLSQDVTRISYLKSSDSFGYVEVCEKFIPLLREIGVKQEKINKFMITNPRRILD